MKAKGVKSTAVGYMGGWLENPAYEDVSALTRLVTLKSYNLNTIHLALHTKSLAHSPVFWNSHDPTTLKRQGPDEGTQYRSAVVLSQQGSVKGRRSDEGKVTKLGQIWQ
jgi:peptide-methionine (S)-S-oxide reductase